MPRTKGAIADKLWADAIRLAVMREQEDDDGKIRKRINIIADKLCKTAADGDVSCMKEIGDRLDGRPRQAMDVDAKVNGELTTKIVREIVHPSDTDSSDV